MHAFCRCLDGIRQVTKWQICARISVKVGQADAFVLFRGIKKDVPQTSRSKEHRLKQVLLNY